MLIVEFHLHTPILRQSLSAVPGMRLRLENSSSGEGLPIRLLFWAEGSEFAVFEDAVETDPSVTDLVQLAEANGKRLYRADLTEAGHQASIYPARIEADGVILSSWGTAEGWEIRVRFHSREGLTRFYERIDALDIEFKVLRVYGRQHTAGETVGLTEAQYEALAAASRAGYLEIPRQATLEEIAVDLGISAQALSIRLRRAYRAIAEAVVDPVRP